MAVFQRKARHRPATATVVGSTDIPADPTENDVVRQNASLGAGHADTQAVLDMMTRKHHAQNPHSKDDEDFISIPISQEGEGQEQVPTHRYSGEEEEGGEEDEDDMGLFKFSPPQPDPYQPGTPPPMDPDVVINSQSTAHESSHYTFTPKKFSPSQSIHAPIMAQESVVGKRRQPYAYPDSPSYTTTHGHIAARQDTPVIEIADKMRRASSEAHYPPQYAPDDRYEETRSVASYSSYRNSPQEDSDVKRRTSSLYLKQNGGLASVKEWDGQETPELNHNEFALRQLGTTTGDEILAFPNTAYSSRGITAESRRSRGVDGLTDTDKVSLSAFGLDEEDSPYPEVRASVSNIDDPEMPCFTFRAWILGLLFCSLGACGNLFFNIRYPSPLITPITIQVVSYPCGKFLAYILPTRVWRSPTGLRKLGFPEDFSLNPGPFNIKEHTIVVIMANVSLTPAYATNITLVLDKFYQVPKGIGFDFLLVLSSQIIGFSFAGLCRRFLVWPGSLVWPSNLVTCTLFNTFHAEDDDGSDGSITRFHFFTYIFGGAFLWYFLPGMGSRALKSI